MIRNWRSIRMLLPAPPRQWTSRSIGSSWQHGIFYALIRIGGRKAAYTLLLFVVLYYTLFRPSVRARSSHYLKRRFPGRNPLAGLWDSYRLNLGIGRILVDRAILGILGSEHLKVSLTGLEELEALLAEGHGLVFVTAHVGCWQLAMSSLSALKTQVSLLIHREEGDLDRHFFEHGGDGAPYRIVDPAGYLGGTLEMLQVLKHGEILCIMGDRVMGGESGTVSVDFLGNRSICPSARTSLPLRPAHQWPSSFPIKHGTEATHCRWRESSGCPSSWAGHLKLTALTPPNLSARWRNSFPKTPISSSIFLICGLRLVPANHIRKGRGIATNKDKCCNCFTPLPNLLL